ncbi:hypothetical protein NLI96_g9194 [Meripilus lineatus]|uniref:Non-specific serine/threonine protein kinase n=1 Tax=Meripilus lineatus TaxID=2056292 RepID=A0AAD5V0L9_9APHY|nr:hypothetical protein NLI96_g9194 [Physisporinus lineatus]
MEISCNIPDCGVRFTSRGLLGLHTRLKHNTNTAIEAERTTPNAETMIACYEDTLGVIGETCCAKYDEISSNERQQEWAKKFNHASEVLKELEQLPLETRKPPGMDVIKLIPGRLKFKHIMKSLQLEREGRLKASLEKLDAKMSEYVYPHVEAMIEWYNQCREVLASQEPNKENVERLKHLVGYLALLLNEESKLFQLSDGQTQSLLDLSFEVLRSDAFRSRQNATQPSLFSKGIGLDRDSASALRRGTSRLSEKTQALPSGMVVQGVARTGFYSLGPGVYGEVYEGALEDRKIAIKRLRIDLKPTATEQQKIHRYICREVLTWCLLDHPNVLPFYGVRDDPSDPNGIPHMISPLSSKGNVLHYLREVVPSEKLVWRLTTEIISGIQYLHGFDIVHGDLRPTNILIDCDQVKVCDFGLANFADSTSQGTISMDAGMQSPERTLSKHPVKYKPTKATDVFALGTVCWEVGQFSAAHEDCSIH